MSFEKNQFEVIKNAISPEILNFCSTEFLLLRQSIYSSYNITDNEHNKHFFSDEQVSNSFSYYAAPCFETLSVKFLPTIERVTSLSLFPTYTYARIYYRNAVMVRHTDRPSCEYSATICVQNDPDCGPWEIWLKTLEDKSIPIFLENGDALIYKGDILYHWRNCYHGNRQIQAFLHYVNQHGQYSNFKFDQRPSLMLHQGNNIHGRNTKYSKIQFTY